MADQKPIPRNYLFQDLTGKRFGKLIVLNESEKYKGQICWFCLCDCGKHIVVGANHLPNGHTQSCGCLGRERRLSSTRTHGKSKTSEYWVWHAMRRRCNDSRISSYQNYGGRGIKVCERWNGPDSFPNFIKDMGQKPSPKHTLERRDNESDYTPENCYWATRVEQGRNSRRNLLITHWGETHCLSEWVEQLGLKYLRVWKRLNRGWSFEEAIGVSSRQR